MRQILLNPLRDSNNLNAYSCNFVSFLLLIEEFLLWCSLSVIPILTLQLYYRTSNQVMYNETSLHSLHLLYLRRACMPFNTWRFGPSNPTFRTRAGSSRSQ